MNFKEFMEEYGFYFVIVGFVVALIAVCGLPFCIRVAKDMWQWALS